MEIAAIPDLSLADCLKLVEKHFDTQAIASNAIDQASVLDYYKQSDRGYRLFHSKEAAMHVALNCDDQFSTDGYMGQVDLVADRLQEIEVKRVLEIGCGAGFNSRHLAARLTESEIVGVDLSMSHVDIARDETGELANVKFEQGDFQQLQFDEATFDAVFAVECLCQATDMRQALAEAFRILRPGGRMVVIDCFRQTPLEALDDDLRLAAQLVEKTMAVDKFGLIDKWTANARGVGFTTLEWTDLSGEISHNLERFYSLARRFFKMPRAVRRFFEGVSSTASGELDLGATDAIYGGFGGRIATTYVYWSDRKPSIQSEATIELKNRPIVTINSE